MEPVINDLNEPSDDDQLKAVSSLEGRREIWQGGAGGDRSRAAWGALGLELFWALPLTLLMQSTTPLPRTPAPFSPFALPSAAVQHFYK
jgi:hypothetical protein